MIARSSTLFGTLLGSVSVAFALAACSGDIGPAGPAGAAGAPGTAGAAGTPGAPGATGEKGAPGTPAPTVSPDSGAPDAGPQTAPPAVYTLSNDATANEIVVYSRAADGALTPFGAYPTGGRGTSAGLGDQGALLFDSARNAFFAVNAGDSTISMLTLRTDGSLALVSKIGSGGFVPISLTLKGDVLYVVNAGDTTHAAQISGFKVAAGGFVAIPASTRPLSASNPAPAQIEFTPDGTFLVVTEKGTNTIDTFPVTAGVAGPVNAQPASGMTPFGFAFGPNQKLIVTEAFGGGAGLGATSSYSIAANGTLTSVSKSSASTQTAPCWVIVNGTRAYVTNTGSNTVTTYTIAADGKLTMTNANGIAATTGDGPADDAFTAKADFLYTRNGRDQTVSIFAIAADGTLTKKPDFAGIPRFAAGLVAR
jgi:6-phosphogluconolactonase